MASVAISSLDGLGASLLKGVCAGTTLNAFLTLSQKICILAGVEFQEAQEDSQVPSSEPCKKWFFEPVIKAPISEECLFRGLLQPGLAYVLARYIPTLAKHINWGIPLPNLISAITVGIGFGALHSINYKKGKTMAAGALSVVGISLGIVKEYWGINASMAAHMTSNLGTVLIDKYYPTLLESEQERNARLAKPQ